MDLIHQRRGKALTDLLTSSGITRVQLRDELEVYGIKYSKEAVTRWCAGNLAMPVHLPEFWGALALIFRLHPSVLIEKFEILPVELQPPQMKDPQEVALLQAYRDGNRKLLLEIALEV